MDNNRARPETITPKKVEKGLSFRLTAEQTKKYLTYFSRLEKLKKFFVDWEAFKEGLESWEYWNPPASNMLIDDGRGQDGACEACGYPHLQIYPPGARPMKCHEAMMLKEAGK